MKRNTNAGIKNQQLFTTDGFTIFYFATALYAAGRSPSGGNFLLAAFVTAYLQRHKRKPLSIELSSEKVFLQKLEYIHYNPVKADICNYPEDYHFSSVLFYENGIEHFNILTHYMGE